MKKIFLLIALVAFLFFSNNNILKSEIPDCYPDTSCVWSNIDTVRFQCDPMILGCENCYFYATYKSRRCPVDPENQPGIFYQDIEITEISFTINEGCENCFPNNIFLEATKAIWNRNKMNFLKLCDLTPHYNWRLMTGSCWKTVHVFIEGFPPIPSREEVHQFPCDNYDGCCKSEYAVTFDYNCNLVKIQTIVSAIIEDNCVNPCYFICDQLEFYFDATQNRQPVNYYEFEKVHEDQLYIKYNPEGFILIEKPNNKETLQSFYLYNLLGELIFIEPNINRNTDRININHKLKGVYFVRIKSDIKNYFFILNF